MTALLGLVAIVAVALAGWAVAEAKGKACTYTNNADEAAALAHTREAQKQAGYTELGIRDVIKTISTKGFKAV